MFVIALFILSVGFGFLNRWLLLKVNSKIWDKKFLKICAQFLPYLSLIFAIFLGFGKVTGINFISTFGAAFASISLVLNVLLLLSLPVSLWIGFISKKNRKELKPPDPSRRLFLKTAAASLPLLAMGSTATGLASSFSSVRFPKIDAIYPELPEGLDGFKILQLSDMHLGYYSNLDNLEKTLIKAEKFNVDMVVVTGDLADNIYYMTDATRLIGQLKTPYDKFISVGNHEYYRSIRRSVILIERGPIPLLLNKHHLMNVKGVKILIGGADDPVYSRMNMHDFLEDSITKTFENAPEADFKLLMSHRPRALDLAPKYGIDLTLSGHTHGGQIGIDGKSFWEIFNENGYLWGLYEKENSKLYTTSGMGHWFPFRLNCPLEAPVITLRKSNHLPA
jgi:uncharacterized protein